MTAQLYYEDVEPGDEIPPLVVTVDETQMFFFSAATYNGHRIHYDKALGHDRRGVRRRAGAGPAAVGAAGPRPHRLDRRPRPAGRLLGAEPGGRLPRRGTHLRRRGHREARRRRGRTGRPRDRRATRRRRADARHRDRRTAAPRARDGGPGRVCAARRRSSESPNCPRSASRPDPSCSPSTSTPRWPRW